MARSNPANVPAVRVTDENRIPMGAPQLQLELPEIPGYKTHWFADRGRRISQALAAGWEYITPEEVQLNGASLAGSPGDGNTDMGSRVSLHGGVDDRGDSERIYAMKIKQEWYDQDMAAREAVSERIVQTLRRGQADGAKAIDPTQRYTRGVENLFTKKSRPKSED